MCRGATERLLSPCGIALDSVTFNTFPSPLLLHVLCTETISSSIITTSKWTVKSIKGGLNEGTILLLDCSRMYINTSVLLIYCVIDFG